MKSLAAAVLAATTLLTPGTAQAGATAPPVNCAKVKCLALTFDDGPGPHTARLLDLLAVHRAKASFYLVGKRVEEDPRLTGRIAREGHEIGNHTYSHPRLTELTDGEILDQWADTQRLIVKATGRRPTTMRPPYGGTDDRVLDLAASAGLAQIMWTGTTLDWKLREKNAIERKVLSLARRDGVILMHDVVPATVEAMPSILTALKKRGYHLVTVSALRRGKPLGPGESYPPRPTQ
ncbi:Peptidoglycan/xylan/chitin deacetylase, PgdA/CDA1 family [Sinosporangium album]|uniref:Peptidoglycan/xylan/chitin deacetylase, PgdA/CDA1 family n=1 Tax=Sinosporangium album TaxID=504805 RepID=A0A1G8D019_9ACTN|nr:polysaccharide deacetylase family protein [Sinosporangium album]SDH50739.1 Peptidoglycan/xylan/chitin deacetylase, PgdA/CDA1 family [Sinosporangium album]